MFIRKKINKGGSCSVLLVSGERVPHKKHPVPRVIKNFGSSNNDAELEILLQQAEIYKKNLQVCSPKAKTLKITSDLDLKGCHSHNIGFSDVYGSSFVWAFGELALKPKLIEKLRDLVVMRIASPNSKRKTAQLATHYGITCNVDSVYKLMDQITPSLIAEIKQLIYGHSTNLLNQEGKTIDVLFYDLTTLYFETSIQDEIRDFGFSKDGKHQHVQIMLAVIVTKDGLPIDYQEFPGNCYEGHTLIPVINKIKNHYNIDNAVLIADSALMNKINLQALDACQIKYVIAARIKNVKQGMKQFILEMGGYQKITTDTVLNDEVKAKTIATDTGDLIVVYHSTKRARKDAYDRQKDLERIKKYVASTAKSKLTGSLRKPYVVVKKGAKIEIDYDKLKQEEEYDGFFGLRTNINTPDPKEMLSFYRGLWQVEQTFRIAKNNLEIRPVFHYTPDRIRAHLLICYMALALIRYVEFKLKRSGIHIPLEQFHLMLDRMRKVQLTTANQEVFEILEDPPVELIPVYEALNLKWRKKFQYVPVL